MVKDWDLRFSIQKYPKHQSLISIYQMLEIVNKYDNEFILG